MVRFLFRLTTWSFVGSIVVGSLVVSSSGFASDVIQQVGSDIDGEAAQNASGTSVATSADGTIVAIGAPGNSNPSGTAAGHVRVYAWNGTAWVQRGTDIDGEAAFDRSGTTVALSANGNTLAIGAPENDGGGNSRGHVRVYSWNGTNWIQRGTDIDGEADLDRSASGIEVVEGLFGSSLALSADGDTVVIGARSNDGGGSSAGHVRVYSWNGTNWIQRGTDIDGEAAQNASGTSVATSTDGTIIAIGAPGNSNPSGTAAGHVRVYAWNGTAWVQRGIDIDGEAGFDRSGTTVALSANGNTLAIGAPENNGGGSSRGHVRIYSWNGTNWIQRGTDIDGEANLDRSGVAVSLSEDGNTLAIGASGNDGGGSNAGHVRVYSWNGTNWIQRGTDIDGEAAFDESGAVIALNADGRTVVIGAPFNRGAGPGAGHARVFAFPAPDPPTMPVPMTPVWRVILDPTGGACLDDVDHTEPWTSVFVGYRYLPNSTDCTRDGYTFEGWATTDDPATVVSLPTLVDPSDGERRMFLAANAQLVAIWSRDIAPVTDLFVFANFLCGPCTTAWLFLTLPRDITDFDVHVNDTPMTCARRGVFDEMTLCELTSLTPSEFPVTVTPRRGTLIGPPTATTITLRP